MGSRKEEKAKSKGSSKGNSKKNKAAGAYVTLTVKPPGGDLYPPTQTMPTVGFLGGNGGRPHHHLSTDRVTAPLPVNQDVQLQMQGCKLRTLQAMRDKASADVEKLWKKYEASGHPQDMVEFEKAQQGLKKIESQMKSFRQSSPNLQLSTPMPFGQFSGGHHSVPFQPPPRHRNPLAGPVLSAAPTYQNLNWMGPDCGDINQPPPLPPRTHPSSMSSSEPFNSSNHHHHNSAAFNNHSHGHNKHFNNTNSDLLTKHNSFGASSPNSVGQSNSQLQQQQQQQTHHRAKSSPDPLSMQKVLNSEGSKRSDSFNDLDLSNNASSSSSKKNSRSRTSGAWDSVDSTNLSPPGSPPPPYPTNKFNSSIDHDNNSSSEYQNNSNVSLSSLERGISGANRSSQFSAVDIIAMEEDDPVLWPNEPIVPSITGFHGPYSSLSRLLEHNAHLAVFINYVIDNRKDPSSLLFYLITAFDIEEGSLKEMKRWGYEIHSTFSAPGAPLLVPNVDENIAAEIDDALLHELDKEEMMRRVFRKARNKAKEEINKQLEEFCNKRTAGLGSMYGPPDNQLEESLHDKSKELRIVETYLVPRVEQFSSEVDKSSEGRTFAIMIAVATVVVKLFGLRNHPNLNYILERHGSFMSKDKSMKSRFISKPKKVTHNGHHFVLQCYSSYTECNVCSKLLWGIGPQGQQCVDCNLNIHRNVDTYRTHNCINDIHDVCLGTNQKNKANDKFRRFKERIRPEKDPKKRISKKLSDDNNMFGSFGEADTGFGTSGWMISIKLFLSLILFIRNYVMRCD